MKYDDASWHSGGEFPQDLPPEAGATHTGMFLAWAFLAGFVGDIHIEDSREDLARLRERRITPGRFFLSICDGKFVDDDLNDEGNAFAAFYFDFEKGSYMEDYEAAFGADVPTLYHVADSWANFDRIAPVIGERFAAWRRRA